MAAPGAIVRKTGGWLTAIGFVFIVLGVMAILEPVVAGLAVALLVGWVLIVSGVVHLFAAFRAGGAARAIWQLTLAILYIVGGGYFLTHALLGLGTLTLLLAVILVSESILEVVAWAQTRGEPGSTWRFVNGAVTLLLGALIWRHWPSSSVWAIGTLVGMNLLMTGMSRVMLGQAARRAAAHVSP